MPAALPAAACLPRSILHVLRAAETTGRGPRSLLALPEAISARADSDGMSSEATERRGPWSARMGVLLLRLERLLDRHRTATTLEAVALVELKTLVTQIGIRVCESRSQRDSFLTCSGDVLLLKLLHLLGEQPKAPQIQPVINELIQILAELAIVDSHLAEAFATHQSLLALLFRLMGHKELVDASLTLAQELLAIGPEVFPLSCVPQLPELLTSLSPRGLALVGRALAVLLAKAAEDPMEGLPAPECVAPALCASCANNQLLLAVPELLPRVVGLLRLRTPPPGLWGHMLAQLPNAAGLVEQLQDEGEQDWSNLGEAAPTPHVVVLLNPDQVPPALRELVAAHPTVIFPGLTLPPAMQQQGQMPGSLSLSALQAALWSTLQADLLYLLWALMGSKTKADAQQRLMDLGLLTVLEDTFERLDWRPPPGGHGAHADGHQISSPQSCLQMQLLRTLQVLCEKDSNHPTYHRLLLAPASREPVGGSQQAGPEEAQPPAARPPAAQPPAAQPPAGLVPAGLAPAAQVRAWAHAEAVADEDEEHSDSDDSGDAGEQEAYRGSVEDEAPRDGFVVSTSASTAAASTHAAYAPSITPPPFSTPSAAMPPAAMPPAAAPTAEAPSNSGGDADESERGSVAGGAPTGGAHQPRSEGLLHSLLKLLLSQPSTSAYHLALASCVHKWVQAASVHDQRRIANFPGLVPYVLDQLLAEPVRSSPRRIPRIPASDDERVLRAHAPPCDALPSVSPSLVAGPSGAASPGLLRPARRACQVQPARPPARRTGAAHRHRRLCERASPLDGGG